MTRLALTTFAAALLGAAASAAGEAQDRIFRVGLLAEVAVGQSLVFMRDRTGAAAPGAPITADAVVVAIVGGANGTRVARVELRSTGGAPARAELPADGGHPVLLLFLETTARAMAEATGGNPFYIKNRMRDALAEEVPLATVPATVDGAAVIAEAATFRPFAADPNRAAMGPFADLALTLVLSDAAPGGFARFEAVAGPAAAGGPAFADRIVFDRLEAD